MAQTGKLLLTISLIVLLAIGAFAISGGISTNIRFGPTNPSTCTSGRDIFGKTGSPSTLQFCSAANTFSQGTVTISSGTKALATSAISSATCSSAQTSSATGTLTTDTIMADFNGDPTAVTGYVASTSGMLTIIKYPTADTVNFKVCNNTSGSITPGAITLNWRVVR